MPGATREQLLAASKLGRLSPRDGKHGKRKSTLLKEAAVKELAKEKVSPVLDLMIAEQKRLVKAMGDKDITQEQYESLSRSLERLTKQIELLSGKPTQRDEIIVTDEEYARFIRRENERLIEE